MTQEEELEILKGLKTNPEFLSALDFVIQQLKQEKGVDFFQMAIFFFSRGYVTSIEYNETKNMTRPFKYDSTCH